MLAQLPASWPLFSAALLLLAGGLLGYALRSALGDGAAVSADSAADAGIHTPGREPATADHSAMLEDRLRAALNKELGALKIESARALDEERQLRQTAESNLRDVERKREQLQAALGLSASAQEDNQRLAEQLQILQQEYADLRSRYSASQQVLETALQLRNTAEAALQHMQRTADEKTQAVVVNQQIAASYSRLKEDLVGQLKSLEAQQAQQVADQRSWADRYAAMQKHYQELARQKTRLEAIYEDVALDRDELTETIDGQRRCIQQLQVEVDRQAQALQFEAATAAEIFQLRHQLDCTQRGLELARGKLVQALTRLQQVTQQRDHAVLQSEALDEQLQHYQRALETIDRNHQKTLARCQTLEQRQMDVAASANEHDQTRELLRTNLIDLQDMQLKCVSLQSALHEQAQELLAVRRDRDEIARHLAAEKSSREQVQSQLDSSHQAIDTLRGQREEVLASLHREQTRNRQVEATLAAQLQQLEQLGRQLAAQQSLARQLEHLQHTNLQLAAEIAALAGERDVLQASVHELSILREHLQTQLASSRELILALEHDRDKTLVQVHPHHPLPASHLDQAVLGALMPLELASPAGELGQLSYGPGDRCAPTPVDQRPEGRAA